MKNYIIIIPLIVASILLYACDDWLDKRPATEITADDLFNSEAGYQEALTGIYTTIASADLYGKNLSWYFIDILGYPYTADNSFGGNEVYEFKMYDYKSVHMKSYINTIWNKSYYAIANINNALKYIDENGDAVLNPISKNLYKGELLALRAYLHLDLMRVFGYGNLENRSDYSTRKTIPYVTEFTRELTDQKSYQETMQMLVKDIKDAIQYLSDDPIRKLHPSSYYTDINANGYWNNREKHLNYYAAQALLARAYMWQGGNDMITEAYKIAKDLTDKEGDLWKWISYSNLATASMDNVDRTFSTEQLFTMDVFNSYNLFNPYMTNPVNHQTNANYINEKTFEESVFESYYIGTNNKYYAPHHPSANSITGAIDIQAVFGQSPAPGPGINDYRATFHYGPGIMPSGYIYYIMKLYQPSINSIYKNRVPLISIAEMYYIMAEYSLKVNNDENTALGILNKVREKRGINTTIDKDMIISVSTEITKECMREFVCEGQLFFYFKRLNILDPTNYDVSGGINGLSGYKFNDAKFLLPYPDEEIIFGRVQ